MNKRLVFLLNFKELLPYHFNSKATLKHSCSKRLEVRGLGLVKRA